MRAQILITLPWQKHIITFVFNHLLCLNKAVQNQTLLAFTRVWHFSGNGLTPT
jgi:hypothetical protein